MAIKCGALAKSILTMIKQRHANRMCFYPCTQFDKGGYAQKDA